MVIQVDTEFDNTRALNEQKFADMSLIYDELLTEILGPTQAKLMTLGCSKCDTLQRLPKILDIEKFTVNISLSNQLTFIVDENTMGKWVLERAYTPLFRYLGDFLEPSKMSCIKIARKLEKLPFCAQEINYKLKIENCVGNLMLFADWKKAHKNDIKLAEGKFGLLEEKYQPHLMVINPNSESTPLRICTTSNSQMPTKLPKNETLKQKVTFWTLCRSQRLYPTIVP